MLRRKSNRSQYSQSKISATNNTHQTEEEWASANEQSQQRMAQIRAEEVAEQRATRLKDARLRVRQSRSATSDELRSQQREHNRIQMAERRQQEKAYQPYNRLAFRYNPAADYSLNWHVSIDAMTVVCPYCNFLKISEETKGMCCAAGKIKLPQLREPPEPLKTWLAGYTAESKHFFSNIRKYNSYFQMTSFGAEIITHFTNFQSERTHLP
ncbi:uncharacterized protein TNCV_160621 [Trichonephila clavipes]|nr:uncharacterized protein TNCV_160621 [Trichonephila clavipes]